ncbi:hypothetical protein TrVE_jg204 [Triparma verrucosa]|nr:hypothetical protein TrVE_jg204 [Triparma verrucosa]
MSNTISALQTSLQSLRTGRASPNILDRINVDYYGAPTPLSSLATVSVSSSQQLTVSPFDKSTIGDIEKSIIESDLGLMPNNSGDVIRLNIPPLTEERRKELMKVCKGIAEDAKVSVRNARRDAVDKCKKLEKKGVIGEDELKNGEIDIDELAKGYVKKVEEVQKSKEEELMKV